MTGPISPEPASVKSTGCPLMEFYHAWSGRLNHLETSRHALMAVHIGAVGYLVKASLEENSQLLVSHLNTFVWVALTFFLLSSLGALARNLFLKMVLVATQLMRIEYKMGITAQKLGYFSGRSTQAKKRGDFLLLGYAPYLFTLGYFLVLLALFFQQQDWLCVGHAALAVAVSTYQAVITRHRIEAAIAEKDEVEKALSMGDSGKGEESMGKV